MLDYNGASSYKQHQKYNSLEARDHNGYYTPFISNLKLTPSDNDNILVGE